MWMFKQQLVMERQGHILQDKLLTSLTTYIELYSCHKDNFLKTSADLAQLCPNNKNNDERDNATRAILGGFCGSSLGAVFGAISGSICGTLGSVGVAAVCSKDLNAVGATVGVFGGLMGGMVAGIFSGVLGGAIGAGAESCGYRIDNAAYNVAWYVIGTVTGAGIGNIFGGEVGAAGGGFGGGLGGLIGVNVAVGAVKNVLGHIKEIRQAQDPKQPVLMEDIQRIEQTFQENTKDLVGELIIINSISSKMDTKTGAHIITVQSSRGLAAVAQMERALKDTLMATNPEHTSCVRRAEEHSKQVSDEMEKMKIEAEKLLASWSTFT